MKTWDERSKEVGAVVSEIKSKLTGNESVKEVMAKCKEVAPDWGVYDNYNYNRTYCQICLTPPDRFTTSFTVEVK